MRRAVCRHSFTSYSPLQRQFTLIQDENELWQQRYSSRSVTSFVANTVASHEMYLFLGGWWIERDCDGPTRPKDKAIYLLVALNLRLSHLELIWINLYLEPGPL